MGELWGADLLGPGQGLSLSITENWGDSCHVPLPADSTVPQAHRRPSHLPPFSTVKPKATIVNKCGLSPKTDEETEGYNMSLLDRGWGRVSTVTPQVYANLW